MVKPIFLGALFNKLTYIQYHTQKGPDNNILMDNIRMYCKDDPCLEKMGLLPMRKQGLRSASSNCTDDQGCCFRFTDSTNPPLLILKISRPVCVGTGQ